MVNKSPTKHYAAPETEVFGPYLEMALCASSYSISSIEEDDITITWLDD